MSKSKVSVFMVTYNHEHYIEKAIESVLMQDADFEFDIVIGEDCSQDNTRAILLDYQKRYPGKFTLLFNQQNIGIAKNWIQTIMACKGDYIAMLEGDDYWTDPYKLQKQADFMDNNPDFSMCFHNAEVIYEGLDGFKTHLMTDNQLDEYTLNDISGGWHIHTATVMFRNGLIKKFPDWCKECVFLDLPFFLLIGNEGRVKFINEVMSVYRKNVGSQIFNKNYEPLHLALVKMHELTNQHFNYKLNKNLTIKVAEEYYTIAIKKFNEGKLADAGYYLRKSILKQIPIGKGPEKYKLYLGIQIYFPFLLKFKRKKTIAINS